MITYSINSGSTPAFASAPRIAIAPNSEPDKSFKEPIGVRAPATMTELVVSGVDSPEFACGAVNVDGEVGVCRALDIVCGDPRCGLAEDQGAIVNVDDGEIGDDPLHHCSPGARQRALVEDLGAAIAVGVFHDDEDEPGTVYQIHGAAHALDHLARHHPIGKVSGT